MTELKGQALSGGYDASHNDPATSFMLLYELAYSLAYVWLCVWVDGVGYN